MNCLSLKDYNRNQRTVFIIAILSFIILIFIHFPFGGYYTHSGAERCVRYGEPKVLPENTNMTGAIAAFARHHRPCIQTEKITAPFLDWESKNPLIPWFSEIINIISSTALILIVSIIFIFFLKETKTDKEKI